MDSLVGYDPSRDLGRSANKRGENPAPQSASFSVYSFVNNCLINSTLTMCQLSLLNGAVGEKVEQHLDKITIGPLIDIDDMTSASPELT
ncbi:Transcription factor steA [Fusarium oxysporum f. sp. albedinis]|nr:Transcription factor steA [Fusarium oxysporum f. sp. albedinis]